MKRNLWDTKYTPYCLCKFTARDHGSQFWTFLNFVFITSYFFGIKNFSVHCSAEEAAGAICDNGNETG